VMVVSNKSESAVNKTFFMHYPCQIKRLVQD
jgi:hypothetical protein